LTVDPRALGDDLHPAVRKVRSAADEAELECPGPRPPAETHSLYLSVYPYREAHGRIPCYRLRHKAILLGSVAVTTHGKRRRATPVLIGLVTVLLVAAVALIVGPLRHSPDSPD